MAARRGKRSRTSRTAAVARARRWVPFAWSLGIATLLVGLLFVLVVLRAGPRKVVERVSSFVPGLVVSLVVPEGFNRYQIAQRLEERGVCAADAFLEWTTDPRLLREHGIEEASAEGYLFPATYRFLTDDDAAYVASRMLEEGRAHRRDWFSGPEVAGRPLSIHEVLTLASIVEKETGRPEERPLVARVFLNRLRDPEGPTRGRLESDPTALYGCLTLASPPASCSESGGRVTPGLLRDATNPYNTYRTPGLPPGPIGNPGDAAVRAVLAPADSRALFFVARGDGTHEFSDTFAEHREAIRRLRARVGAP